MSALLLTLHLDIPVPPDRAPSQATADVLTLIRAALGASSHYAGVVVSLDRAVVVSPKA